MSRSDGDPGKMGNAWFTHKRKVSRSKSKSIKKHKQQMRRKGK